MGLQHDLYNRIISSWFQVAKREYLFAESVVDHRTPLGRDLRDLEIFDHRDVQHVHDLIAAQFRYVLRPTTPLFPEVDPTLEELKSQWLEFAEAEFGRLIHNWRFLVGYCQRLTSGTYNLPLETDTACIEELEIYYSWMKDHPG